MSKLKYGDGSPGTLALLTQCSTFLTNDHRFRSVPDLSVILLSQINSP
ncbi:hypothetical protein [Nostoc sp.]